MASSFLRRGNPYNPRYAMPGYVLQEGPRNAVTSPKLPRGWGGPPHAIVNRGLPRGYVDGALPTDLAGMGSLSGSTMGFQTDSGPDPIAQFGQRAAQTIVAQVGSNVVNIRKALARVGSGLVTSFDSKVIGGMRPQAALAAVLSNRLLARAAAGRPGLGDVPPPPGTGSTYTAVTGGRTAVDGGGQAAMAPVWSSAAKSIIAAYQAANPGAIANPGVASSGGVNFNDKKAFFIRPVNLVGSDLGTWKVATGQTGVVNPQAGAILKGLYPFTPAGSGLLKSYNPSTKTLQMKSVSTDLFTLAGQAISAGVNALAALPGQIAGLACQAVNSPLAQTAVIIGAGAPGAAGVASAQNRCNSGGGYAPPVQESGSNMGILLAVGAVAAVLLIGGRR